jgi:hypothetical protein
MSKKGQDSGIKTYDYYGTIAGVVCLGVVDSLNSVTVDNKVVWHGPLVRDAAPYEDVDIPNRGTLRIYWGTDAQTVDSNLESAHNDRSEQHPDYKGVCYVVLKNFLFGRERTTAPNVSVEVSRAPNQSIITGDAADLADGQANSAAVLVEMLTSIHGMGFPAERLNGTEFQAIADELHAIASRAAISPFVPAQTTLRALVDEISTITDCWLQVKNNLLEPVFFSHGEMPASYTVLSMSQLTERPAYSAGGWLDAATSAVIEFEDRDIGYKRTGDRVPDLRALQGAGQDRPMNIKLEYVTRRSQALAIAAECLRVLGRPQLEGEISVRREHARSIPLGSWILLDIDIEPGGATLSQYFRVVERVIPRYGPYQLLLDADETLTPLPYTPTVSAPENSTVTVPEIIHARILEASGALVGGINNAIVVLAERPSELISGLQCWFDTATDGEFVMLGEQVNFAARATLRTNLSTSATSIEVTDPGQIDSERFSAQPGAIAAADDTLLAIVVQIDAGAIDEDSEGNAILEICSVSAITNPSGSNYNLTVSRGRRGTSARAFTTTTAEVWIMPRALMTAFVHAKHAELRENRAAGDTPATGYYRLAPYTYFAARDIADCDSIAFQFPLRKPNAPNLTLTTPASSVVSRTGPYPTSVLVEGTWDDQDANLVQWQVWLQKGTDAPVLVTEETFGACTSRAFSRTVSISEPATWYIYLRAMDATGVSSEQIITVGATGTGGKVATPTMSVGGVVIPQGANTQIYGPALLECGTTSATIKYRYTDAIGIALFGSDWITYGAGSASSRPMLCPGILEIEAYAEHAGYTDSETASWTIQNGLKAGMDAPPSVIELIETASNHQFVLGPGSPATSACTYCGSVSQVFDAAGTLGDIEAGFRVSLSEYVSDNGSLYVSWQLQKKIGTGAWTNVTTGNSWVALTVGLGSHTHVISCPAADVSFGQDPSTTKLRFNMGFSLDGGAILLVTVDSISIHATQVSA